MSVKTASWILLLAIAAAAVVLFNHWASFQPLSTLAYAGIVLALGGLANLALPFRFLGIRRRLTGALLGAGGLLLAGAALFWPAASLHVAQQKSLLDAVLPDYQFSEHHAIRVHAPPAQVMEAVRQSTWGDLRSLGTLLRIRALFTGVPEPNTGVFSSSHRVFDTFAASGYLRGGTERELLLAAAVSMRPPHRPVLRTLPELTGYREPGWIKTAFDFRVEDAGNGWSTLSTETRMAVDDQMSRGPALYWRLIVPGSGLLRRQWLEGIRRRAERSAR